MSKKYYSYFCILTLVGFMLTGCPQNEPAPGSRGPGSTLKELSDTRFMGTFTRLTTKGYIALIFYGTNKMIEKDSSDGTETIYEIEVNEEHTKIRMKLWDIREAGWKPWCDYHFIGDDRLRMKPNEYTSFYDEYTK